MDRSAKLTVCKQRFPATCGAPKVGDPRIETRHGSSNRFLQGLIGIPRLSAIGSIFSDFDDFVFWEPEKGDSLLLGEGVSEECRGGGEDSLATEALRDDLWLNFDH